MLSKVLLTSFTEKLIVMSGYKLNCCLTSMHKNQMMFFRRNISEKKLKAVCFSDRIANRMSIIL